VASVVDFFMLCSRLAVAYEPFFLLFENIRFPLFSFPPPFSGLATTERSVTLSDDEFVAALFP